MLGAAGRPRPCGRRLPDGRTSGGAGRARHPRSSRHGARVTETPRRPLTASHRSPGASVTEPSPRSGPARPGKPPSPLARASPRAAPHAKAGLPRPKSFDIKTILSYLQRLARRGSINGGSRARAPGSRRACAAFRPPSRRFRDQLAHPFGDHARPSPSCKQKARRLRAHRARVRPRRRVLRRGASNLPLPERRRLPGLRLRASLLRPVPLCRMHHERILRRASRVRRGPL